jgi:transposase
VPRLPRYPSDLTDAQWALIEPLLPPPSKDGRRPTHRRRDIVDAILYIDRAGCAWRALPVDFPPWQTVYGYFARWHDDGVTKAVHDALRGTLRAAQGRHTEPTAGAIDAQSVKGADTVGKDSRGYDAGKKINGRKRFIVTDTLGLLLTVMVCAASVQDRQGGRRSLLGLYLDQLGLARRARHIFADGAFAGQLVDWAHTLLHISVEVVRKPAGQRGFAVIPRRWVVERTYAWMTAHRRLARDYERHPAHSEAMIYWAMIGTMARRIDRGKAAARSGPRRLTKAA